MSLYLGDIKSALLLFPLIAFVFTIPYMSYNYHKMGHFLNKDKIDLTKKV
nr:hypothetical protein [uncultured Bacillus sp.]